MAETTITNTQIRNLRREAAEHGDTMQTAICDIALGELDYPEGAEPGSDYAIAMERYTERTAREACAKAIAAARANED